MKIALDYDVMTGEYRKSLVDGDEIIATLGEHEYDCLDADAAQCEGQRKLPEPSAWSS